MNAHARRAVPFALLMALAIVACAIIDLRDVLATTLPLQSDQDGYLVAAEIFSRTLRVDYKAPLYSIWLGVFDLISGHDPWRTFVSEKIAALLLLGFGMGWLGYRLHSPVTGALLLIWVMNMKYLVIESNGSNTFATLLIVYGAIGMLYVPASWKAPVGALTLFLAWQTRPEFAPILGIYLLALAGYAGYEWLRRGRRFDHSVQRAWGAILLVMIGGGAILRSRMSAPAFSSSLAVYAGFAAGYVERYELQAVYDSGWNEVPAIWEKAFPTVTSPLDRPVLDLLLRMWRANRTEFLGNLEFNLDRTPRIVAAVLFGFQSRVVMALSFALYLVCLVVLQRRRTGGMTAFHIPRELWILMAGLTLLIPFAIVILPLWRYFIPLTIPFLLTTVFLLSRGVVKAVTPAAAS